VDPDGREVFPDDFVGPLQEGDFRASELGLPPDTHIPDIPITPADVSTVQFPNVSILPVAEGTKPYSIHFEQYPFILPIPLAGKATATNFYTPQNETFTFPFVNSFLVQYDVTNDAAEQGVQERVISSKYLWNVEKKDLPSVHVYPDASAR
jgi:hypothetical protein